MRKKKLLRKFTFMNAERFWRLRLSKLIPNYRFLDTIVSFVSFLLIHKRLPSNKLIFNDVLYKIKTTDEILNPLRVFVTDKEFVKIYIKAVIGDKYNVPTFAVLKNNHQIDNFNFPENCCIKPTHSSGMYIIRKNNESLDISKIKKWLKVNYYKKNREANYDKLKPKIIVEPLLFDSSDLNDFKFFCFKGKVKLIQVDFDRRHSHKRMIYDIKWVPQKFTIQHQMVDFNYPKPKNLDEMIIVCEALSQKFDFIRVDLYSNDEHCYVGEITNCHGNASEVFIPRSGEFEASRLIFS